MAYKFSLLKITFPASIYLSPRMKPVKSSSIVRNFSSAYFKV